MTLIDVSSVQAEELDGHWGMVARQLVRSGRAQLVALVCDMEPDGGAEEHVHERADHLFFVVDGQLDVTFDAERVHVAAGQALVIEAGAPHATRNPGPTSTRYVALTYAS